MSNVELRTAQYAVESAERRGYARGWHEALIAMQVEVDRLPGAPVDTTGRVSRNALFDVIALLLRGPARK